MPRGVTQERQDQPLRDGPGRGCFVGLPQDDRRTVRIEPKRSRRIELAAFAGRAGEHLVRWRTMVSRRCQTVDRGGGIRWARVLATTHCGSGTKRPGEQKQGHNAKRKAGPQSSAGDDAKVISVGSFREHGGPKKLLPCEEFHFEQ